MPLPIPRTAAARAARKYSVPALALLHLSAFQFFRNGTLGRERATVFAASAILAAVILLSRDLATSRRKDRLPDVASLVGWGATALLELHFLSPAVSASRVVPAVVFPAISFLLPGLPAAVYALVCLAWFSWSPGGGFGVDGETFSITALAVPGLWAGWAVRTRLSAARNASLARIPLEETRSLILPWETLDQPEPEDRDRSRREEGTLARQETDMEEGIRRVLEGVFPIAGADRIMYVSPAAVQGRPLLVRHVAPMSREARPGHWEIPDSYVPYREAMLFRRPFFAEGDETARWGLSPDGRKETPTGVAAVPVTGIGTGEGVILAFRFGDGKWTEPVVQALEMGAFFIGREITQARRRYQNERLLERQDGFHRLARMIAEAAERNAGEATETASPRQEVYGTTAEQILLQLRADRVLLIEAERERMRGRIVWEAPRRGKGVSGGMEGDDRDWTALDDTYAEWVLNNNVHRIFSGVRSSPGKYPILPGPWARIDEDAFLLVPVDGGGGFHGILVCASRADRTFHKGDAETAREILAIMRMGISHALQIETLETKATSDGLTGLLNQKTFRERLSSVLSRLDGRYECAVIMLDLDHFKRINDTFGHPAGDHVLRSVANIIRKTIRKADMAGRYGGEEFVLYLHQADRAKAVQVAERLRLIIRQTRFDFGGKEIGVTASLGIACHPSDGRDSQEILALADEALYGSKQEGRDRITVYRKPS